jgi:hypothetical protein
MKKILTALVAALAIGAMAVATSSTADARWYGGGWGWRGGGWGWGWGAPFVAGAVIGGALAAAPYYSGYYGYYPQGYPYYPGYYGCRRVWNGWAWVRACY